MSKTVLVTGGAHGIGAAISKAFFEAGYEVIIHYNKSEQEAKDLALELNAKTFRADFCDLSQVEKLAELLPDTDVLVNNAGVDLFDPFDLVTAEQAQKLYTVNLHAPLLLTRKLLPSMLHRGSGNIINISSVMGVSGASCEVDYSVAKAGIIRFTQALAREVGASGIRVNCICPGFINTDMNSRLTLSEYETITDTVPLGRAGDPCEVAQTAVFLASDNASYINGACIQVDGGIII